MRFYILLSMVFGLLSMVFGNASCGGETNGSNPKPPGNGNANVTKAALPVYTFDEVKSYPHDPKAFSQGLVFKDGFLYESTGQEGESTLRKVDLETGKVLRKHELAKEVFAEGIAILGEEIFQLSWRDRMGWVYSVDDFKLLREFPYSGEGWGLTHDGTNLFMSDGTHVIRVVNPKDFSTTRTIVVRDENGRPLMQLNELEYVKGEIWANIWHSEQIGKPNHIARIDPASGKLLGWIDLGNISPDDQSGDDKEENTLNGIAYDEASDRLFVTGKNWKKVFEIKVKPKQ
ncbi:MAG: glutaminyl-peptide cyclotransferase [Pyrinomonadaceae bacterium]